MCSGALLRTFCTDSKAGACWPLVKSSKALGVGQLQAAWRDLARRVQVRLGFIELAQVDFDERFFDARGTVVRLDHGRLGERGQRFRHLAFAAGEGALEHPGVGIFRVLAHGLVDEALGCRGVFPVQGHTGHADQDIAVFRLQLGSLVIGFLGLVGVVQVEIGIAAQGQQVGGAGSGLKRDGLQHFLEFALLFERTRERRQHAVLVDAERQCLAQFFFRGHEIAGISVQRTPSARRASPFSGLLATAFFSSIIAALVSPFCWYCLASASNWSVGLLRLQPPRAALTMMAPVTRAVRSAPLLTLRGMFSSKNRLMQTFLSA
jgi:hypothetical protein